MCKSLQWRHNERDRVSNHQSPDCLFNRLFKAQIKENIKAPRHWPLWGEFPGDGEFPHKGAVTGKMDPFDDVIMISARFHMPLVAPIVRIWGSLFVDTETPSWCFCRMFHWNPWTKWPLFRRRYIQIYFCEWKFCILIKISLKFIPKGPVDNKPWIGVE